MSESKGRLKVLAGGLEEPNEGSTGDTALRAGDDGEATPCPAQLVVDHLSVADALARRYRVPGRDIEDIRQVARLGLVIAAKRYRAGAGHGFVQFAVPTIAGTIKRHLRDHAWVVRPPRSLQELRLRAKEAHEDLVEELGREPSMAELGEAAGSSAEAVAEALHAGRAMVGVPIEPLDSSAPDDGPIAQVLPVSEPGFEEVEQRMLVAAALKDASAEDLRLVKLRFVDEMSQSQIAAELGVSQMQVSRLLRRLLDRMRRNVAA